MWSVKASTQLKMHSTSHISVLVQADQCRVAFVSVCEPDSGRANLSQATQVAEARGWKLGASVASTRFPLNYAKPIVAPKNLYS